MFEIERPGTRLALALALALSGAGAVAADAFVGVRAARVSHPALRIAPRLAQLDQLALDRPEAAERAERDLELLGADPASARLDVRGDRWETLLLAAPIFPGRGIANQLRWAGERVPDSDGVADAAWHGLRAWLAANQGPLRIDIAEVAAHRDLARIAVHEGGALVQIVLPRVVAGVPVWGSRISATLSHGNLVLLGTETWGTVVVPPAPALDAAAASAALAGALGAAGAPARDEPAELVLLPLADQSGIGAPDSGAGYFHRWAWSLRARPEGEREPDREALVDATTGELLWLEAAAGGLLAEVPDPWLDPTDDDWPNDGAAARPARISSTEPVSELGNPMQRAVVGGVFPRSNDLVGNDGTEQAGWPMPFARASTTTAPFVVDTDAGGNLPGCAEGQISTVLDGPFFVMDDDCGALSELTTSAALDLGTSSGNDCVVPVGHSAGDTHAIRTAFFTLNRFAEAARARLPDNAWLNVGRSVTVNELGSCDAFYSKNTEAFTFRRSFSGCRNGGESPSVVQVVYGTAIDRNDANGAFASPSWATPYALASLHSARSCVGRGFALTNCSGNGDPCTACNGVAEVDWAARQSATPHTVAWADLNCGASSTGPCGGFPQCEGSVVGEAIWDLATRDLTAPPFSYSQSGALEVATRLLYLASGAVASWYECATVGGCPASSGYLQFLAADDDNGNLLDGTPHMTAIRAAFERHQMHCATPAVANSGCGAGPFAAPVVTATPRARAANLSWTPVAGASSYRILRADGVSGCDDGKVPVGETSATSFVVDGLRAGRTYSFVVVPIGAAPSCVGPASSCATVVPVDDLPDECALLFRDGFESRNTLAWSSQSPALATPDVYRWTDLDLRDPHVYANLPIFGCQDVTDTSPLGAQFAVNAQVQQSIATDSDVDGELDLSKLLAFRPFEPLANAGRLDDGDGACAPPSPPASCDWRMPPVPATIDYDGFGAGTCLDPLVSTTHGYSPAIATATAPCYVSEARDTSVLLLGALVPLRAARSAAKFDANDPPTSLSPGLWIGFLREADADAALVTVPSLGTAPLSSYLPGGTGNCAAHDDRDVGPQGESGWWVYFNFVASPVSFVGR